MMKRIRLFCDPMLVTMANIWWFLIIPFCTTIFIEGFFFSESSNLDTASDIVISALLCLLPVSCYLIFPKAASIQYSYVVITPTGIIMVSPFKEKATYSYKDFKSIKIAYYRHLYENRYFLVLSRGFISMHDLTHINQLKCSDSVVKIKITKRRYRILCEILPEYIKNQVVSAMENSDFCVNIDIERTNQQRQKMIKRKKEKRRKKKKKS